LGDPINRGDMDNTCLSLLVGPIPLYSVNVYLYQQNNYYSLAYITSPSDDMEWTQNYEWICGICASRSMWFELATVLGPNPVTVDWSLCQSYQQTNNTLLWQPLLWTAQAQVDMKMLSCSGNMPVARDMQTRQSR
jgi:hypothetical protein